MLRVDSNDVPMTQTDLWNQKLQIHEGRAHKIVLDKSLFVQMYPTDKTIRPQSRKREVHL